jgi:bilirubin oxidase
MPNDSVKLAIQWLDFADNVMPYMYHCHMLHHEDDGMMGQFLVIDTSTNTIASLSKNAATLKIAPNPCAESISVLLLTSNSKTQLAIFNAAGVTVNLPYHQNGNQLTIETASLINGLYWIQLITPKEVLTTKFIKQ